MNSILIARPIAARNTSAFEAPGLTQRLMRKALVAQIRGLSCGAVHLHDALGSELLGNPDGALGTVEVHVYDPSFWSQAVWSGDVGVGEAYVQGLWSTPDLVRLLSMFVRDRDVMMDVDRSIWSWPKRSLRRCGQWLRSNSRRGSQRNIQDHYDLGDELFAHFLDPSMTYSSAIFERADMSLDDAQQAKLRRLCTLVELQMDDRLLEIGTGWGSLARMAAGGFGARVTTTTISQNQFDGAGRRIAEAGLGDRVEPLLRDYRDLEGTFDKVLSCEMIEAVGARYLPTYLRACNDRLRPGGLLGLQAITIADQHYATALEAADYIQRHVFPGSFIPSVTAILDAARAHTDLRIERVEQFGEHYARTLAIWRDRVLREPTPFIERGGISMLRAWDYYFAYCEAGFREGHISVSHLRFRKGGR